MLLSVGLPVLAVTSRAGAANGENRCVSVDGVKLVQSGTAECESSPSHGTQPNIAIANGANSQAFVNRGDNNEARANGPNSVALVEFGSDSKATANGPDSGAFAGIGNNNTATANGAKSHALASD